MRTPLAHPLTCFLLTLTTTFAAPTFAERLGWKPTDVVILPHVDDAGMSHPSNQGSIESVAQGIATSWSVMMPCPWVPEIAAYLKDHPNIDSGLHLTLTSEWKSYRWSPLAGASQVPGLTDPQGCLWPSVEEVVANASPEEVDLEIRAQYTRAERMGLPITHLDSHMGTLFAHPAFFEKYVRLGIEKQVPILMPGSQGTYIQIEHGEIAKQLEPYIPVVWNAGLPVIDDLHASTGDWPATQKSEKLVELLKSLKPGITMIIFHSARPSDEFPLVTGSHQSRLGDLQALTDPKIAQFIHDQGIHLTTWKELMQRRQKAAPIPQP
jgi:predicted glycoside hydrolase/deacetylase ChbG (UPF0249 family)